MKNLNPYLNFNGNCREAMTFYAEGLSGNLELMPFSKAPMPLPDGADDYIMHAILTIGDIVIMASDNMPGQPPIIFGDSTYLSISAGSLEEIEQLYTYFSQEGKITMPLQDTFWGARFGIVIDKFGIGWMFNYDYPTE